METDRRGLALSTTSPSAAVQYRDSAELFLLGRPGAQDGFASAVQADPDFAEAHVGLAFSAIYEGDNEATKRALSRAQHARGPDPLPCETKARPERNPLGRHDPSGRIPER